MKVRQGFVSNSSSSSFIVRGVVITDEEATALLSKNGKEVTEDYDLRDAMDDLFPFTSVLVEYERCNDFDGDEETGYIIGQSLGSLEDGSFVEIREFSQEEDEALLEMLSTFGIFGVLETYVKMVSNDNY